MYKIGHLPNELIQTIEIYTRNPIPTQLNIDIQDFYETSNEIKRMYELLISVPYYSGEQIYIDSPRQLSMYFVRDLINFCSHNSFSCKYIEKYCNIEKYIKKVLSFQNTSIKKVDYDSQNIFIFNRIWSKFSSNERKTAILYFKRKLNIH